MPNCANLCVGNLDRFCGMGSQNNGLWWGVWRVMLYGGTIGAIKHGTYCLLERALESGQLGYGDDLIG